LERTFGRTSTRIFALMKAHYESTLLGVER
jgi:hypothetical protein